MEEKEKGVTFGEICAVIKKRIWLVLPLAILLTILSVLAVAFLYNPGREVYELTFELSFLGTDLENYPDGSPFHFQEIISAENLAKAQETDEQFAAVNVEKMTERGGITIRRESDLSTLETDAQFDLYRNIYTVSVESGYFKTKKQATAFLKTLVNVPLEKAQDIADDLDYSLDRTLFDNADYDSKLNMLTTQKEKLLAQCDLWIEIFHEYYTVNGRSLHNYREDIDAVFSDVTRELFLQENEMNAYSSKETAEQRKSVLEQERELNNKKLEGLREELRKELEANSAGGMVVGGGAIEEGIAELTTRNAEIDMTLDLFNNEAEYNTKMAAFSERLNEQFSALDAVAKTLQSDSRILYEQSSLPVFATYNAQTDGGMSVILAAIGGFVLWFILLSIVFCCVDLTKMRKREAAASAAAPEETSAAAAAPGAPAEAPKGEAPSSEEN